MAEAAITFDFHNTVAIADEWFALEVRRLPSAFLAWWAAAGGPETDPAILADADAAYRRLRAEIVEHGREQTAESCVATVLNRLGLPVDPAAIERGVEALMRDALEPARPVPGVVGTVRALAEAGVPLGIVSSAVYHPFLEWTLDRFAIRDAFADVTTSASAGYYKSRPEIYAHALGLLGADPARSVHVGDSYRYDVGGARRAGMRTVWLQRDGAEPDGNAEPMPDLVVTSLEGAAPRLLALLRSPNGR